MPVFFRANIPTYMLMFIAVPGYVRQTAMMRAGINCSIGELPAMSTALDEYSHFIEETVTKNAELLAQCDESDNGTEKGV